MRTHLFGLFILAVLACNNGSSGKHENALPHNLMSRENKLSAEDEHKLKRAKGKTVFPIGMLELVDMIETDSSSLLAVNFWKMNCQPCLAIQQGLQIVQVKSGSEKLKIISVNLDEVNVLEQINLLVRTEGITAGVFQLQSPTNKVWHQKISPEWTGELPALLLRSNDDFQQFFQRDFSENELSAILQPFLH